MVYGQPCHVLQKENKGLNRKFGIKICNQSCNLSRLALSVSVVQGQCVGFCEMLRLRELLPWSSELIGSGKSFLRVQCTGPVFRSTGSECM